MKTNAEFISGLEGFFRGEPWFGESMQTKLKNVSEAQAFQRPKDGEHSIAEIVSHMEFWRKAVLAGIRGDKNGGFPADSPENWPALSALRQKGWKAIQATFAETHEALVSALKSEPNLPEDIASTLQGTMEHDVYHLGQIGFVKKLVS